MRKMFHALQLPSIYNLEPSSSYGAIRSALYTDLSTHSYKHFCCRFSGKPLCADCDKLLEIVKDTGALAETQEICGPNPE